MSTHLELGLRRQAAARCDNRLFVLRIWRRRASPAQALQHFPFICSYVDEPNHIFVCTEYCTKGSLQEVLEDEVYKLDNMFIASLVMDLVKGD